MRQFSSRIRLRLARPVAAAGLAVSVSVASGADPLRILPLGDSITWGWGAEFQYGYRGPLGDLLSANDIDYEFVGSMTDQYTRPPTWSFDPSPVRELNGSDPFYGIPGASADRLGATDRGSLLWSLRNDEDGDDIADAAFANAGGLIPTLASQGKGPDAVLLHIGTNDMGPSSLAVTPNPGSYSDNAADSQLYRLLTGLESDLTSAGLLTGAADDTDILLAKIIPRGVDSRTEGRGAPNTDNINDTVFNNVLAYNNAIDAVVASLSLNMRKAITVVDFFTIDLTDPAYDLQQFRNDGVVDQPYGSGGVFNEQSQTVGGQLVDEADLNGPDYADWFLRFDEASGAFYDAALTANDLRWNQGLFGVDPDQDGDSDQVNFNGGLDYRDGIHPNGNGYELMAHVWYGGLLSSGAISVIPEPSALAILGLFCYGRATRRETAGV